MKQSQLFTRTRKEAPKDEVSKNASLLIRAGYINKEMAGAYSYLPLGLRVLNKIADIIREEMNAIGGQELFLTTLQDKGLWEKTGRWSDDVVDNWFKTSLKNKTEVGLGFTHEEPLTEMLKDHVSSHKDLPFSVYQIQTKFRNELRAKSGIMRGREFMMKDLYSFSKTQEEHDEFYARCQEAYARIFDRVGLGDRTFMTFASGGNFSKYSHEFQTLTDAGEDTIYLDEKKKVAVNHEVYDAEGLKESGLNKDDLVEKKAVEVGNIFSLGTKYSEALGLNYVDEAGARRPVIMGSYGIGLGRLMGTIVEVFADDKGIVWPESVAPFAVHLISIGQDEKAQEMYKKLKADGVGVLYDDREVSAGVKLADSDLLGVPKRVVVSEKSLAGGGVEVKMRDSEEVSIEKV